MYNMIIKDDQHKILKIITEICIISILETIQYGIHSSWISRD